MGIYDRDWYREEYKKKEEAYGGDFSLGSKRKERGKTVPLNSRTFTSTENSKIYTSANNCKAFTSTNTNSTKKAWPVNLLTILLCPLAARGAILYGGFDNALYSAIAFGISIVLFILAARRRKKNDKGILNALAMISSMLSYTFSFVATFWILAIKYGWLDLLK